LHLLKKVRLRPAQGREQEKDGRITTLDKEEEVER
jgi:hypothetical protein